jgi:NAD(P)-dependent dehydrogenase (short-subunit alcohol dehydrogenase family)
MRYAHLQFVTDKECRADRATLQSPLTLRRQWADELGMRSGMEGTTFNSVSVGFTKTEAYDRIPSEIKNKLTAADAADVAVANRIGEVEDIAGVVGLLVSEKARVSVERHRVGVSLIEFSGSLEV